jgi:hypothetical protein
VARRRMVLRRIDPFSVLKFGAVANLAVAAIGFVALTIVSRVLLGSGLVAQICEIAADVGFLECGVDEARVNRLLAVWAVVWAVVQTALLVLLAFLHNLIADLTGGIAVTMEVETPPTARPAAPTGPEALGGPTAAPGRTPVGTSGGGTVVARPGPAGPNDETTTVEAVDALEAVVQPRSRRRPGEDSGTAGRLFGDRG